MRLVRKVQDQNTLMERDQMKFIFQRSLPRGPLISSIGVAVLGPHWLKKSPTADMTSDYEFFQPTDIYI